MGPYLFANAALTGFFLFGAIYHFILWSRDRRNWTLLLFSLVTLLSSMNSAVMVTIAGAESTTTAQWALNLRGSLAVATVIAVAWLFAHLTGFLPRKFLGPFTAAFGVLFIYGLFVPLAGTVTGVARAMTPWGETISVLSRVSPSPILLPVYAFAITVPAIGLIGGRRLMKRDRVGGVLTIVTSLAYLSSVLTGVAIDIWRVALPYLGPIVTAIWVLPIAWQVARDNQQQAQQLVATERRYRAIFDQTFQFIGLLDVHGTLIEANQTALEFAGLTPAAVIGKPFWETPWWTHSRDLQDQLRHAIRAAARGEVVRFEATHPGQDGQIHHIDFSLKPVYDAKGEVVLLIPEGRDITNRVLADEAKRSLEQQLLQAQKMEALGQLAGGVAHDFNNLLTVIAGHTEMLMSERGDKPTRYDLEQIRQASDRAASMTRQLLAFSRQSVLEPKVINLNTVVSQMETMLRRSIGEDIELVVRAAPDVHHVRADPDQLGRALLNMAINARDAMPEGGRLIIETCNVELPNETVSGTADAGATRYVLLSMSDTGCGMTPETRSHLFEPFYTTKGQGKGTGLGLAVVDGIVKQSGGRIDVFSEPGTGTTFTVYLPATDDRDAGGTEPAERRPARGTETVLLVEDEPAVREMTQAALQKHGYTVLPAASGAEALQIAHANRGLINVVVTDVVMPGMSGPQLVERLRSDQPQLAALFMSGYTSDAVLRHGIEKGEADFLQKPFSTSALAAKLRQVLDR
jgi:PAS domain S-box-containing protein